MHLGPGWTVRATRLSCAVLSLLAVTACSSFHDATRSSGVADEGSGSGLVVRGAGALKDDRDLPLTSRVTRIAGQLSDVRRERVARQARAVVADYLDGAFADGHDPFERFVPGLRRTARRDASVLRGDGEVTSAAAWFSVAAPRGRAVGVTARLAVELLGDDGTTASVTGRLLLTKEDAGWGVFGYDLAKGER